MQAYYAFAVTPISRARHSRGWSQRTVAAVVGVSCGTVANVESGTRRPSLELLARLRLVLELSDADVASIVAGALSAEEQAALGERASHLRRRGAVRAERWAA